jgi:cupin superfamily acireductone dioxygenase involved in methionine salvage
VKISVAGVLEQEAVTQDILSYMDEKGYKNNNVGIQIESDTTRISLRTEVEKDEQVNTLSKDIQDILITKGYIQSTNDVLEQSITGPSVGSYMQKAAKNALIV